MCSCDGRLEYSAKNQRRHRTTFGRCRFNPGQTVDPDCAVRRRYLPAEIFSAKAKVFEETRANQPNLSGWEPSVEKMQSSRRFPIRTNEHVSTPNASMRFNQVASGAMDINSVGDAYKYVVTRR
jgi:hypothetical protein